MEGKMEKILGVKKVDEVVEQNADIELTLEIEEKLKSLALVEIRRAVGTTQTNNDSADAINYPAVNYGVFPILMFTADRG